MSTDWILKFNCKIHSEGMYQMIDPLFHLNQLDPGSDTRLFNKQKNHFASILERVLQASAQKNQTRTNYFTQITVVIYHVINQWICLVVVARVVQNSLVGYYYYYYCYYYYSVLWTSICSSSSVVCDSIFDSITVLEVVVDHKSSSLLRTLVEWTSSSAVVVNSLFVSATFVSVSSCACTGNHNCIYYYLL